jgi:hypothetical protein
MVAFVALGKLGFSQGHPSQSGHERMALSRLPSAGCWWTVIHGEVGVQGFRIASEEIKETYRSPLGL